MPEKPANTPACDIPALLESQGIHFDSSRTRNMENRIQVLKDLITAIENQSDAFLESSRGQYGKTSGGSLSLRKKSLSFFLRFGWFSKKTSSLVSAPTSR
jgi:hypothetical protein